MAAEETKEGAEGKGKPATPNSFGFAVGKSASKDFFAFAACFEPLCEDSAEGEMRRVEGFKSADPNGNGLCSLAELDTFVLKCLLSKYPKSGKGKDLKTPGKDLHDQFRPCCIRAFHDAKDYKADSGKVVKGTKKATDDDFVSKEEFKLFNIYTIIYAAMFDAFSKIDGSDAGRGKNDDKRITEDEWLKGYKKVGKYGFVGLEGIEDKKAAKALFSIIDDNGGGVVLLDEWCHFIKQAEVKANTAVGKLLALDEPGGVGKQEKLAAGKAKVLKRGSSNSSSSSGAAAGSGAKRAGSFSSPNKKKESTEDAAAPSTAAAAAASSEGGSGGDAGGGGDLATSALNGKAKQRFRDMCRQQHESEAAASKKKKKGKKGALPPSKLPNELKLPGFTALVKELLAERSGADAGKGAAAGKAAAKAAAAGPSDADVKFAFEIADKNKSGTIDEGEFATLLQLVLAGQVKGLSHSSMFFGPSTKLLELREAADARYKALEEARAKPNAFGFVVGKGCSKDFLSLAACFEPLCEDGEAADKLRQEAFTEADPNGNGLCSLAELETFVMKKLVTKYPKTGKGYELKTPGKDLFDAFRPCYIRAFHDAKDYKADSGEVIKGTKNATDDDFVSKEEFKLFNIYTIIYAAMFDAFSKIDGGDAGRGKNDDKRITEDEWLKGYKKVGKYGFVGLEGIEDKKAAKALFSIIDDNGGGVVLLDEWCFFLKEAEVKANTAVGKLLALDEGGGSAMKEKLAGAKARALRRGSSSGSSSSSGAKKSGGLPSSPSKSLSAVPAALGPEVSPTGAGLDPATRAEIEKELELARVFQQPASRHPKVPVPASGAKATSGGGGGGGALPTSGELELAKHKFRAMASGGTMLHAPAFGTVVRQLLEGKKNAALFDADVKAAFELADTDNSGALDEGEFLAMFKLILQGEVKGLGSTSTFFGPSAKTKKRRSSFQEAFSSLAQETEAESPVTSPERAASAEQYRAALDKCGGAPGLTKSAFKKVLKEALTALCAGSAEAYPRAKELDDVFALASSAEAQEGGGGGGKDGQQQASSSNNNSFMDESSFLVVLTVYATKYREAAKAKAQARAEEKAAAQELKQAQLEEAKESVRAVRRQKSKEHPNKPGSSSGGSGGGAEVSVNPLTS